MPNTDSPPLDARLLKLAAEDNIVIATTDLAPGDSLAIDGRDVSVTQRIPTGHKLALQPIAPGDRIVKYGLPIGSATTQINPGEYVHTHNVKSDYLPTYTLDGDHPYMDHEA